MGRHTDSPVNGTSRPASSRPPAVRGARRRAGGPAADAPARAVFRRPRSRGRLVLGLFAIAACAGIALVTTIDPYAGATASPYYQAPARASGQQVQRFDIAGGYVLVDVKRDTYTIVRPAAAPAAAAATGSASSGAMGYTTPSGVAQAYAAELVAERGWAASEFTCLVDLWNRESGWSTHAENPSGAYGIPQSLPGAKMATFGADWQDDYRVQIKWGLSYISGSYGSPCGAWGHSNAYGWY